MALKTAEEANLSDERRDQIRLLSEAVCDALIGLKSGRDVAILLPGGLEFYLDTAITAIRAAQKELAGFGY
jgi:hypothetical protein